MRTVTISETDNGKSLALGLGDDIVLTLAENPTTGYRWQLDSPPGLIVSVTGDSFTPGSGQIGGGGTRTFSLRALRAGAARLSLKLKRSWDPADKYAQEFNIELNFS